MKHYWDLIINLGIYDWQEQSEVARIRLLNKLAFLCILFAALLLVVRLCTTLEALPSNLFATFYPCLILYLNKKENYHKARILACFGYPIAIFLIILDEGAALGEFSIFLVLIVLAFILFDNNKKIRNIAIFWTSLVSFISYAYVYFGYEVNPVASNFIGTLVLFQSCVLVLSYMIIFYQKEVLFKKKQNEKYLLDLQKKNLELEKFAFISSHDLKVPLKNIIGFSKLTSSSLKDSNIESAADYIDIIHTNARRMDNLIEDTLEIISYDKKHSKSKKVNLNKVVDQIIEMISGTIQEQNVTIIKHKKLPKIKAIKSDMLSCFKNLIENAIKYNERENPIIEIDFSTSGENHYITFKDNGIGIKENQYDAIFEMYQRLVRQDEYEGTGLGLPICKKIIEKIGGKIWVESKIGEGSIFYLKVPTLIKEEAMLLQEG